MSARENLSKLASPTDIGNEELILSHRQKIIQEKRIKCYAEEIASGTANLLLTIVTGASLIIHPRDSIHAL